MDVTMPDGTIVQGVPEGITKSQLLAKYSKLQPAKAENPGQGSIPDNPGLKDYAKTALDQGMQGATFGFSDEITDRVGALIASKMTGTPYADMLKQARSTTKDELSEQFREMPKTSIISNLAGGLLTGGAGAETAAGGAISNSLRTGNLAARVAKGAAAGASSGALYGAGTADSGSRLEGAEKGSIAGLALGAAVPVAGAALSKLNTSLGKKPLIPNADKLREKAGQLYKLAEEKGGVLKPEFTNKFVDEIEKLKPQTKIGKIVGGDTPFTKAVEKFSAIRDEPITLDAAQEIDELLSEAIDGFTEMGRVTKQGKKLLDVQSTFRNMIDEADESLIEGGKEGFDALKQGRKLWSTSRKLSDIERIIQRAESMDNPASAIKSGFTTMLNNPNRLKGFSKAERTAIKKAAESGVVSDILRTAGSRLIPIVAGASGGGLGGTALASATSMAARGAATRVQLNKAKQLADLVANQGPVTKNPLIQSTAAKKILEQIRGGAVASGGAGNQILNPR